MVRMFQFFGCLSQLSKEVQKSNFRQNGQMEKQRWEESEKRREEERRSEKRKGQRKEDAGARKGRKVATHYVFPMICGSRGSKSRLAKATGAEPSGQMRDENLHVVVARSTFASQNVQSTPTSDHFWKLRCRKSAGRCGAKHIWKSKVLKTGGVERSTFPSQKCTKDFIQPRNTCRSSDVEKVHAVVARSTFRSQNAKNATCSDHF